MINHKKIVIIFITLFFIINFPCFKKVFAKGEANLKFQRITVEDGLSQASVEKIFQDSKGHMWFGTADGLNKYNGSDLTIFKHNIENSNSLSSNYISDVIEDSEGNIWIGTSRGLNKIEHGTDNISRVETNKNIENGISHYNVWDMTIDSKGNMWIATEDGLNKYNKDTKTFTKFFKDKTDKNSLTNNFVTCICEDNLGNIWIGTKDGLSVLDPTTNNFYNLLKYDNKPISVVTMLKDYRGDIWISLENIGLVKFDVTTKEFKDINEGVLSGPIGKNIQSMLCDSKHNMWLASSMGVVEYNLEDNSTILYTSKSNDRTTLVNDNVLSLFEDKSGLIWIGTYNGISILNPNQKFSHYKKDPTNINSLSDDMISGIYEDNEGLLWIGTNYDGLNSLNKATGEFKKYFYSSEYDNSISSNRIWAIEGAKNGDVWIATANGLNKFEKSTGNFKKFEFHSDLSPYNKDVRTLYEDENGMLWIGTRGGLQSYDTVNGEFREYNNEFDRNEILDKYVSDIYEDPKDKNILWLGSGIDGGLIKFHKTQGVLKNYKNDPRNKNSLSFNSVRCITGDDKGNLWIATNSGLNYFDSHKENFKIYTEVDGLVNNFVYGILLDEKNNPWVSTNGGLSKLDIDKGIFINFTVTDGLQGNEFNGHSYFKNKDGEMFFGGINGITSFFPETITENNYTTNVVLDNLKVHDKTKDVDLNSTIMLNYNENNLSLEYFLPDYRNSKKITYEYQLEGVDKDWVFAKNRNYANYTLLDFGDYIFKVRARNGNGQLSDITSIKIHIKRPPWKTPLAYIIYSILLIALGLFIWNYVKILERMVKQRTAQLNNKLEENSRLYDTIIKHEKFKNNYFVDLSHELRTPLNVILSTVQLLNSLNSSKKIDEKVMNKYLPIIGKNSNNLLNVINDLIDSSKIEAGSYKLNIQPIDIVYLVEETALSMKEYIEGLGIELIIDPEFEEKIIECDPTEIGRCVTNLLSNSSKYNHKGGCIWVYIKAKDKDYIEIIVKDTGVGISKKDQEIIFDRFSQAKNSLPNSNQGSSGIGLTLVKHLVTLHKGKIYVSSELGHGSEFIITLPIKQHKE